MNKNYIWAIMTGLLLSGCIKDVPVYNQSNENAIGFTFNRNDDSTTYQTFAYDSPKPISHTVYVEVRTIGFVTDYDRKISVRQVQVEGQENGVPGVHYVPFTDEEIAKQYSIKAGEATAKLPVVVLYNESLKDSNVIIRLTIEENEHFKLGLPGDIEKDVVVSDIPVKPSVWPYNFGTYGPVKHQFMIDVTRKRWDDEWMNAINRDSNERKFWANLLKVELAKENEYRLAHNQDVLRENDDEKTPVKF